jgi:hypothetical protein
MHTIHQITDEHLICLDDNDNEYVISRRHFEQWLNDTGRDTGFTYAPEESNHIEKEIAIDWYDQMSIDKSNDLKQYCKTQYQHIIDGLKIELS